MKTVKRVLAATLAVVLILQVPAYAASFKAHRGLNLDQWNIWPQESDWGRRNVLLPYPEWRRTMDADDIALLRESGFDFVRMPVDPLPFLSRRSRHLREKLLASIADGVDFLTGNGMKVIVDLHPIPRGQDRFAGVEEILADENLFGQYLDLVADLAQTLGGKSPETVAFELMNEPVMGCEGEDARRWNTLLTRLHETARKAAPETTLVLNGACWGSAEGLAALDPDAFDDENLIWGFHSYAPYILTHQGALWAGDFIKYVTGIPYPPHEHEAQFAEAVEAAKARIAENAPVLRKNGMLAYLDELLAEIDTPEKLTAMINAPFKIVDAWAAEHGIASDEIILSEFGMIRQEYGNPYVMEAQWRADFTRDVTRLAEERGYAWALWGYGGAFGTVEAFGGEKAEPNILDMVKSLPPVQ
ncbi:glycoside hydrolase family 5 protein [Nitratireductor basaltis]|uniref:Glycoside hydrolase family protein n=1 Tax=Nitratireductor basaltis TaxID=472175 RepID=A0A084UEN4_9HYPH|nr:cellulase family glycosylhydrolase [Nitratireductor basaltis]KFB11420.1 Glycoside hydrolase family protein [Nitratireductor basaltis]